MNEIWKDIKIPYYKGLYQVSNFGRVKALKRTIHHKYKDEIREEHIMTLCDDKNGYKIVTLKYNKINKTFKVHRLVAEAFIPNKKNLPQINHKDENKQNNRVENLEWCDNKYNINYGNNRIKAGKKLKKKIEQYDENNNLIKIWDGLIDIRKELGYYQANIRRCCNGLTKK